MVPLVYDALLEKCIDDSLFFCHMDELQSGPLMVKALTGRHFVVELWLREPMLVCGIMR